MPQIRWTAADIFTINGYEFDAVNVDSDNKLVMLKVRSLVESYTNIISKINVDNVIEVGIARGGSAAFMNELLRPRKILCLDIDDTTNSGFKNYLNNDKNSEIIKLVFGIDQSSKEDLLREKFAFFGSDYIDLVIDDASHFYEGSLATFEALFPMVRPGGMYVIEDWGWAHWRSEFWQSTSHPFINRHALSNLIFELTMACAGNQDVIKNLQIDSGTCIITRGDKVMPQEFKLKDIYELRGKSLVLI